MIDQVTRNILTMVNVESFYIQLFSHRLKPVSHRLTHFTSHYYDGPKFSEYVCLTTCGWDLVSPALLGTFVQPEEMQAYISLFIFAPFQVKRFLSVELLSFVF